MKKKIFLSLVTMLGIIVLVLGRMMPAQADAAPAAPASADQVINGPVLLPGMDN